MFSNETIRKLREIHMGVMAEQLSAQLEDPHRLLGVGLIP